MKTIVFILVISILYIACDSDKDTNQISSDSLTSKSGDSTLEAIYEMPACLKLDSVKKMVGAWQSHPHNNIDIVQQITMDGATLRRLMKSVDRIKFIAAEYLEGPRKGQVTIIIQTLKILGPTNDIRYCDIREIFDAKKLKRYGGESEQETMCPPPDPCDLP